MKFILAIGLAVLGQLVSPAALARIYIPVDQPAGQLFPIAVADLDTLSGATSKQGQVVPAVIRNDLALSGYFDVIPPAIYLEGAAGDTVGTIDFSKWTLTGAAVLIKGRVFRSNGELTYQLKLFDTNSQQMLMGKHYVATEDQLRLVAHRFANEVMLVLTGMSGVFDTRIAYVSRTKKGEKSILVMDMDGENSRVAVRNKSLNLSPAWSPEGGRIAYTSYVNGPPDLYIYSFKTKGSQRLTTNGKTNITPAWIPGSGELAYSSSMTGEDSDIYVITAAGGTARRLTSSFGIDIAPRFMADGTQMVFASERAGNLHLFRQSLVAGDIQRLTFVGRFNDSPDISPDGTKIVFCGQDQGAFDIFTMGIDGANIQRLTLNSGNNEHPRWSPDGRLIAFSSTRDGGRAIYLMRFDGANQVRISAGDGSLPDWGPRAK